MVKRDNYYTTLGLKSDTTIEEIKNSFRKLAKQFHPDRYFHPSQKIWAIKQFQKLVEAYETLSHPQKRKEYDESLNVKDIATQDIYEERSPKDIYYFWYSRIYFYFLPVGYIFVRHILHLYGLSAWDIILLIISLALFPWAFLSMFPPFWFGFLRLDTKNMGCFTSIVFIIGAILGASSVWMFLFDAKYKDVLQHLPFSRLVIVLFYLISITGLFSEKYIKEKIAIYASLILGLIFSGICTTYSFNRNDWFYAFLFCFYMGVCLDFLISMISHEYLKRRFATLFQDIEMKSALCFSNIDTSLETITLHVLCQHYS